MSNLALDDIRKIVIYQNTVDIWIAMCQEQNVDWNNTETYKKFIAYLLKNNLQLNSFNLCSHEAGATEEKKSKFAELLAETKDSDPNSATYTIKLNDNSVDVIRKFSFEN